MAWSIQIGTVKDTVICIHLTFRRNRKRPTGGSYPAAKGKSLDSDAAKH